MDDEEKLYWMKILMGMACGILSIVVIPQNLVVDSVPVGWYRLLWLLGTWLLLPTPIVLLCLKFGWLGVSEKDKTKIEHLKRTGEEIEQLTLKESFKKFGSWKYVLKTGVGAFFFVFLLSSTLIFTIIYPF